MQSITVSTVEAHTGGEPFRIITKGLPKAPGSTIVAKRKWFLENHDYIRKELMLEPRGHADMYGGYLVDPVTPLADFGVIFIHNNGYSDHCGHGLVALAYVAVSLGWVEQKSPQTKVTIDAPCGLIEATVDWDGNKAGAVRFVNVPSFLYIKDAMVTTPSYGDIHGDICFGGAFYFYLEATELGIPVDLSTIEELKKAGAEIEKAVNEKFKVVHPFIPEINHAYGAIISDKSATPGVDQKNICIFADRQVDRSPTGSGTGGRVAQLYARGKLPLMKWFQNESIIGSIFKARVLKEVDFGGHNAVVSEIEGTAQIVGYANWIVGLDDEISRGFLVRRPN